MSAEPLSREERDNIQKINAPDDFSPAWKFWFGRINRYEATVQAVEAACDESEKQIALRDEAIDALTAERDALERRVEALRAWIDTEGRNCPSYTTVDAILAADDEAAK